MHNGIKFHFEKPEDSSGFLLWQLSMLWQRRIREALSELKLTHTQFVLLAALGWLRQKSEAVTQKEVAEHARVDKMMVSKVLRSLESHGLIVREEHPVDTRAKVISLTPKGQQALQQALLLAEATDRHFFAPLQKELSDFNHLALQILKEEANPNS
ncbi:MAG: MarR family transcriptional regulator [Phaeodactylibacter sp.]|nr:MarR family transcriptional regulator [Phaeodactylibacter sp.]MCB9299307.1 MarR family transcriptional regulator [Lewinellaceae bacterium]